MVLGCGGTPGPAAGQLRQAGISKWCFTLLFLKSLLLSPDFFLPSHVPHTSSDSLAFHRTAVSIETGGRGGYGKGLTKAVTEPPMPFPPQGSSQSPPTQCHGTRAPAQPHRSSVTVGSRVGCCSGMWGPSSPRTTEGGWSHAQHIHDTVGQAREQQPRSLSAWSRS